MRRIVSLVATTLALVALALPIAITAGDVGGDVAPAPELPFAIDAHLDADERALEWLDASTTLLVVPKNMGSLSAARATAIISFVDAGGRLLVIEDAETAALVGLPLSSLRIVGPGIASEQHPVLPASDATVLASTRDDAYLDVDQDGSVTSKDVAGPFALAASTKDGRVVVTGAPLEDVHGALGPTLRSLTEDAPRTVLDLAPRGPTSTASAFERTAVRIHSPLGIGLALLALVVLAAASAAYADAGTRPTAPNDDGVRRREAP